MARRASQGKSIIHAGLTCSQQAWYQTHMQDAPGSIYCLNNVLDKRQERLLHTLTHHKHLVTSSWEKFFDAAKTQAIFGINGQTLQIKPIKLSFGWRRDS